MDIINWFTEVIIATLKHGWSITTFLVAIAALLRVRKVKQRLKKLMPMLFSDDSEVKEYVQNQVRIESKIDALMAAGGVKWHVEETPSSKSITHTGNYSSPFGWMTALFVHIARLRITDRHSRLRNNVTKLYFGQGRKYPMKKKLLSRKFILAVVTALLIILNDGLDLGIDSQTVIAFAGIVATYIVGEAATDVAKAKNSGFDDTKTH